MEDLLRDIAGQFDLPRVGLLGLILFMLSFAAGIWGGVDQNWRQLPECHPRRRYGQLRHRRWMQLRVLVVIAAAGMAWGISISPAQQQLFFLLCWCSVIFLWLWITLLGLLLAIETRVYFLREQNRIHSDEQVIRQAIRRERSEAERGEAELPNTVKKPAAKNASKKNQQDKNQGL